MTPQTKTYNTTETALATIRTELAQHSFDVTGDSGKLAANGFEATYDISHDVNGVVGQVAVTITFTAAPPFGMGLAWHTLNKAFTEPGSTVELNEGK